MKPLPEAEDLPLCEDEPGRGRPEGLPRPGDGQRLQRQLTHRARRPHGPAVPRRGLRRGPGRQRAAGYDGHRTPRSGPADPQSPAVRLVKSFLGPHATVVEGEQLGLGVVVVVGEDFEELVQGKKSATTQQAGFICSPPGSADEQPVARSS